MRKENEMKTLYKRFLRGERAAIAEFAEAYRAGLVLFINGFVRDYTVAEDLAGEAFATLIIKKPKLKNEEYLKTYLFTTAKNTALSWLRKHKRELPLVEEIAVAVDSDIEEKLLLSEERKIILRAVDGLVEAYRTVLILRYWDELTPTQIARVLKKSKKQVYNLLQRAKEALKNALQKEGFVYEIDE